MEKKKWEKPELKKGEISQTQFNQGISAGPDYTSS